MTFKEALKRLGIADYEARILASNSHGELFHVTQYVRLAHGIGNVDGFREWFEDVVKHAEDTWERPESVFQHLFLIIAKGYQN